MNHKHNKIIDTLIATQILGWSNITSTGKVSAVNWYNENGKYVTKMHHFKPTSDLNRAIKLLEYFDDYTLTRSSDGSHRCEIWEENERERYLLVEIEDDSLAMAICIAILEEQGIEWESYQSVDELLKKDVVQADGQMHTTCSRCNRPLRSRESQMRGYGPECWKKEHEQPELISLLESQNDENFMDELTSDKKGIAV
ncbi:DUF6011 domain-containing protein [Bacillus sp. JCM 19034]|uniref:DUF6011 domain-containing protein n=1 Tax=Bacillus sp. JCM 19034 TaxID=1481928 RepID=UPI000786720A|nr:DUF6011 domain-containing protein [Bacillus sp. JCM 19034]